MSCFLENILDPVVVCLLNQCLFKYLERNLNVYMHSFTQTLDGSIFTWHFTLGIWICCRGYFLVRQCTVGDFFAFLELSKKYRNNYKLSKILVQTYRPTKLIDACIFGCLWHPSAYPLGMVKKYLKKKYPTWKRW